MYKPYSLIFRLSGLIAIFLAWTSVATAQSNNVQQLVSTCAACHGSDGNGFIPDYPKLAGLGENYLLKQLRDIQASQTAGGETLPDGARKVDLMAGLLKDLSDSDLQAIAAFYANQSLAMTGATADLKVKVNSGEQVDSLALGENLYRYGNQRTGVPACSGCHSPTGQGNSPAGFPRLGGQYPNYVAQQLKNFRGGERTNDGESQVMRQVAELMSDAEISAVANYVSGLH
jgi:cytochrome c553